MTIISLPAVLLGSTTKRKTLLGNLRLVESTSTEESYECRGLSSERIVDATIDRESQWISISLEKDSADFRGVATRARFTKAGQRFEAFHMESAGVPHFYDFSMIFNQTTNETELTLTYGAIAFKCTTAKS